MDTARSDLSTARKKGDPRIVAIAKQVSESRDRKVASILLQLKPILDEAPATSEEGVRVRQELWKYNLLKVMMLVLRQDFSVIQGEWATAAELANLMSKSVCGLVCVGVEEKTQLQTELLPKTVDNLLLLARHIHNVTITMGISKENEKERGVMVSNLKKVLDAIVLVATGYFYISSNILSSQWLLQILVSDTQKVTNMTMGLMEKLIRIDGQVLSSIDETTLHTLMDELVYKLTVNTDVMIAAGSCRCILRFCDSYRIVVEMLCQRYRGLRPLLRRWEGRGFDRDLRHLVLLLESGSVQKAMNERQHESARYIQAVWRGYLARKKLKNADRAFAKFQKSYRLRKAEQEQVKLKTRYQTDLVHEMKLRRQQLVRNFHERRLQALEILPAGQIEEYLRKEKSVSALRIQTLWRGHRERSRLTERQKVAQQVHAAILIQRAVRKWLDRVAANKQEFPRHLKPQGLNEDKRAELNKKILQWREQNPIRAETLEDLTGVHKRTQEALGRHYYNIRNYRKLQYQAENLLARLDTDTELIALAPSLPELSDSDVKMYSSTSLPVATAAKQQHQQQMKKLNLPWWKSLAMGDAEVDEDERERVVAEVFLDTMGV